MERIFLVVATVYHVSAVESASGEPIRSAAAGQGATTRTVVSCIMTAHTN
jgi:hypothetical protein